MLKLLDSCFLRNRLDSVLFDDEFVCCWNCCCCCCWVVVSVDRLLTSTFGLSMGRSVWTCLFWVWEGFMTHGRCFEERHSEKFRRKLGWNGWKGWNGSFITGKSVRNSDRRGLTIGGGWLWVLSGWNMGGSLLLWTTGFFRNAKSFRLERRSFKQN